MHLWYRFRIVTFTIALWTGGVIGTAINARLLGTKLPIYIDVAWSSGVTAARLTIFAGACIALLGALLRLWGSSYLGGASVWSTTPQTQVFVTAGPFAWVRNPLYLGNFLIVVGFFATTTPFGLLGSLLGLAIAQHVAVIAEERTLCAVTGKRF
ncbi:MAG: methyltransferase family protein, partial [Vulcanimicrobiaceae bacterium]